jgi:hypothetical protein
MRINTISLALMMPSGAVHPIIPGPAKPEPGIHNPETLRIVPVRVMDSGLGVARRTGMTQ